MAVSMKRRTEKEMMQIILSKAERDERIRAVALEGSRANPESIQDEYSDFDIAYYVKNITEFTKNPAWIQEFGEILIVQCPDDWYDHIYDYNGYDKFTYLIQFMDGNRMDLTLVDLRQLPDVAQGKEPRILLINKDQRKELQTMVDGKIFYIQKPSEKEFYNTVNEFRWVSLYITKGLCRKELYYAKYHYDGPVMEMFIKMLNWKVGLEHQFLVSTGSHGKYLQKYLSTDDWNRFQNIFPNAIYSEIWDKLFFMYDFFTELELTLGEKWGYQVDAREIEQVRCFMMERRKKGESFEGLKAEEQKREK